MDIPTWQQNQVSVCKAIEKSHARLKLVLKTKNEPYFLESWIHYHLNAFGKNSIIIMDNGSTDPSVMASYQKYSEEITVISFSGFHNDLHNIKSYLNLYGALKNSSDYYTFLDTDEFLTYFDGCTFSPQRVLDNLSPTQHDAFIPATWLLNAPGFQKRFICGASQSTLRSGLSWGKPILQSSAPVSGFINHNCQNALNKAINIQASPGFFIKHFTRLSPRQRINANIKKLVARGFGQEGDTVESLLQRDRAGANDIISVYINEIKNLMSVSEQLLPDDTSFRPGTFAILQDNSLRFHSRVEEEIMREFHNNFERLCSDTFRR